MKMIVTLATAMMISSQAMADVAISFVEGAPKDRFVLTNTGSCDHGELDITLDLSTSASAVIFDVSASGAGVEVFQPFEVIQGGALIGTPPLVSDGDRSVSLNLSSFPAGETVAFTIDVDDTRGVRQITVEDDEIGGATASVRTDTFRVTGTFEGTSSLVVPTPPCA